MSSGVTSPGDVDRTSEPAGVPAAIQLLLGRPGPNILRPGPPLVVPSEPECLFCKKRAVPFESEEHVISEGLMNDYFILPPGIVCDPCNHGPLSRLDHEFLGFPPVAFMRTWYGVPTKRGAQPEARLSNARLFRREPNDVFIEPQGRKAVRRIPGGVQLNLQGRRMTGKYIAQIVRFLFKATIESMVIDRGLEIARSPELDELREIVLGAPFHGYLTLANQATPRPEVEFTHDTGRFLYGKRTIFAAIDAFGVEMYTDLLVRRPPLHPDDLRPDFSVITF